MTQIESCSFAEQATYASTYALIVSHTNAFS